MSIAVSVCRRVPPHRIEAPCNAQITVAACTGPCTQVCGTNLVCGHTCTNLCCDCTAAALAGAGSGALAEVGRQVGAHAPCRHPCARVLACGHTCDTQHACSLPCPPCERPCSLRCPHSSCGRPCGALCVPCMVPCGWRCTHQRCAARCSQPCTRGPCKERCQLPNPRGCSHPCMGVCGERCPRVCAPCAALTGLEEGGGVPRGWVEPLTRCSLAEVGADGSPLVVLACGHIIDATMLAAHVDHFDPLRRDEVTDDAAMGRTITVPTCPECRAPLEGVHFVKDVVRRCQAEVDMLKRLQDVDDFQRRVNDHFSHGRLEAITLDARSVLDRTGGAHTPRAPSLGTSLRIAALTARARVELAGLRPQMPTKPDAALQFVNAALAEPFLPSDSVAARLRVHAAMLGADTAAQYPQHRETAARLWATARQACPASAPALRAQIDAVADGAGARWAISAMVAAVGQGHAFRCRNGHVYFIGECGGAMERGRCPDCGEGVGGGGHAVDADNTAAGEVDGTAATMPGGAYAHGAGGLEAIVRAMGAGWG